MKISYYTLNVKQFLNCFSNNRFLSLSSMSSPISAVDKSLVGRFSPNSYYCWIQFSRTMLPRKSQSIVASSTNTLLVSAVSLKMRTLCVWCSSPARNRYSFKSILKCHTLLLVSIFIISFVDRV